MVPEEMEPEENQTSADLEGTQSPSIDPDFFKAEDYLDSFAALKRSMLEGHDLKKKQKAMQEYANALESLKATYADRLDIAANYTHALTKQEELISMSQDAIKHDSRVLGDHEEKISEEEKKLSDLKKKQEERIAPLREALDQANAKEASAKAELKQVKSQRDSLDQFEKNDGSDAVERSHDQLVSEADAKLAATRSVQRDAQKALSAREKEDRSELKKVQDSIKDLKQKSDEVKNRIKEHEKKVAAAKERIEYCNYVVEHPEETEEMDVRIKENEKTLKHMEAEIGELATTHAQSRSAASKARTALIVCGIALVIIIIVFLIVANK